MRSHPLFAALYDRMTAPVERRGLADRRRRLLSKARGRVLEVGAGTGHNLPHYREVEEVVALEPDAAMRRRLLDRVVGAAVPVQVHEATIEDAGLEPASFDTAVCALVLCTVPDIDRAVAMIGTVLRPDGNLLFLEHVRGAGMQARVQRLASPVWQRLAAGCHPDRDPLTALRAGGFFVTDCEHFRVPLANPIIGPAVQGIARPNKVKAA